MRHAVRSALSRQCPHDLVHSFLSRALCYPDDLSLAISKLVSALLVSGGQPVTVAIDDTLFLRRGYKVWAASCSTIAQRKSLRKLYTATIE